LALRIIITGAGGQLGQVLLRELGKAGHDVAAFTHATLDLTRRDEVLERVAKLKPDVIVNTAAFGVDASEEDPRKALEVNGFAVQTLADAARRASAGLVQYSSDFVFDGETSTPYTESARPNPRNVYGASKLLGECLAQNAPRHWVLRVESLFGNPEGKSSVDRMVADLKVGRGVKAFSDRTVSPSYMDDVAAATKRLLERNVASGIYHCVSSGFTTWYELAVELKRVLGASRASITSVSVDDMRGPVVRPKFCALSNEKLANAGIELPSWQNALQRYLGAPRPVSGPMTPPVSGTRPRF
jgi:dTDP-4-dehydrorhamnose reductase